MIKATILVEELNNKKYDELLNDEDIDVMYIATPNHLHYQMCKQALERGKHVICEKPFTSNVNELDELIAQYYEILTKNS